MRRSTRNFNTTPPPPLTPPGKARAFELLNIPAPSCQTGVQMPHPIVGFVRHTQQEKKNTIVVGSCRLNKACA